MRAERDCDVGSLTLEEFNKLADQTNDFAVDERGEAVGDDGIMSSHPPAYVRNRLKDRQELQQMVEAGTIASEELGRRGGGVRCRTRVGGGWDDHAGVAPAAAEEGIANEPDQAARAGHAV